MADIARPHGIELQVRYLERLPVDTDEGLFKGFDAVFFDSYLQDVVQDRLARALPGLHAQRFAPELVHALDALFGLPAAGVAA